MVERRRCKFSVLDIIGIYPSSASELIELTGIPKSNLRIYLWRWANNAPVVIERLKTMNGEDIYRLTPLGREYQKKGGKIAKTTIPKVLTHA